MEDGRCCWILNTTWGMKTVKHLSNINLGGGKTKVCKVGGGRWWFQEELGWEVGCGDKAKFWEDVWIGSVDL